MKKQYGYAVIIVLSLAAAAIMSAASCTPRQGFYKVHGVYVYGNVVKHPHLITVADIEKRVRAGQLASHKIGPLPRITAFKGVTGTYYYEAVLLQDVIGPIIAQVSPPLQYRRAQRISITAWAPDGFGAVFSWGEMFNSNHATPVYLAYKTSKAGTNEELHYLKVSEGAAFRLVVPTDKTNDERSVKWLQRLIIDLAH